MTIYAVSVSETVTTVDKFVKNEVYTGSVAETISVTDNLFYILNAITVDTHFNIFDTVISQYANSPIILALVGIFADCFNADVLVDDFYVLLWNIDTAQNYGLDVWGRIVGVTRTLTIGYGPLFGFNEMGLPAQPFNSAPFYSGSTSTINFELTDIDFRTLIFAKAFANISDGSIPSINQLLLNLFPGLGNAYVIDGENMTMTYVFKFPLDEVQQSIVSQSGVLTKPAGVNATVIISP